MLVELAVGDAYGAGFEYANGNFVRDHNDLSRHVQHPRHGIVPGSYTDDTQMTLAIAELLVDGVEWTPLNLASKFVEVFKRDEREGYSGRFYKFLKQVPDGETFLREIQPESDKSGAAMRATPLGLLPDMDEVKAKCNPHPQHAGRYRGGAGVCADDALCRLSPWPA
jgi:ADP-ribosylglycohydrolase